MVISTPALHHKQMEWGGVAWKKLFTEKKRGPWLGKVPGKSPRYHSNHPADKMLKVGMWGMKNGGIKCA